MNYKKTKIESPNKILKLKLERHIGLNSVYKLDK